MFTILIGMAIAGLIVYLAAKLTIKFLKTYRKKKQSKIFIADMRSLIKNIPDKEKRTYSFDDLEKMEDETVIAEYDEDADEIVKADFVGEKGMEDKLEDALEINDGVLIIQ